VNFSGTQEMDQGRDQEQRSVAQDGWREKGSEDPRQQAAGYGQEGRQDRTQGTARAHASENEPRPFQKLKPHPQQEALF